MSRASEGQTEPSAQISETGIGDPGISGTAGEIREEIRV